MRVVQLLAENVKKLTVVDITPTENLVQITGPNGSGKSSVLDSLWWALEGAKHIQAAPIRKGANKARIKLDLGELIVERRFTPSGTTITVENREGARYPSPQKMLDELLGSLTFDPLAFVRMDPRMRFEALRRLVKLDLDLDELAKENERQYAERTEVNRTAKSQRARLDAMGPIIPDLPSDPINTDALIGDIAAAGERNAKINQRRNARAAVPAQVDDLAARAYALESEAEQLRARADQLDAEAKDLHEQARTLMQKLQDAEPLPDLVDVAALQAELQRADKINAGLLHNKAVRDLQQELAETEARAVTLTEAMDARHRRKIEAISAAKMPIEGLTLGDGVVLMNGLPLDQASSAEQLRISAAIAMAGNPKLRVLRIKDGSLLDDNGLRLLSEMATASDYQIWIERVDTTGRVGIVLEDGHVVTDQEAAE
jgi:DNA repair exonuclease SbcCD ATPase subunit